MCAVSYTHLDVYKRQVYNIFNIYNEFYLKIFSPYLEHVSGRFVFPSSALLVLRLVKYLCVGWLLLWFPVGKLTKIIYKNEITHTTKIIQQPMAVSYTHLDVYKRQSKNCSIFLHTVYLPKYIWVNAVSYTHLDVYKRQQ